MAEPGQQICPGCGGTRVTEKVEHTVETDAQGNQTPRVNRYISPCGRCGGAGVVTG